MTTTMTTRTRNHEFVEAGNVKEQVSLQRRWRESEIRETLGAS